MRVLCPPRSVHSVNFASSTLSHSVFASDWNFWDAETDSLTHAIHRYSGKFIPQIAGQAIDILTRPNDLVVDPYCGSGTTLLEAGIRGRRAIGSDLNPLAALIARVKTTPVEDKLLRQMLARMTSLVSGLDGDDLFRSSKNIAEELNDPRLQDPWFTKWFQAPVLLDLLIIRNEIDRICEKELRHLALVAFSDILRRSSNAHQGYPNVMFDRHIGPRPRPGRNFLKALKQTCDAVSQLWPQQQLLRQVSVIEGDGASLDLDEDSVDAVVTHPPYVGSIPYAEYGALSLKWLGYEPKDIDRVLTGGRRQTQTVLSRFSEDYRKMIGSAFRWLKPGGHIFLLVGNPTVHGEIVDLSEMTVRYADSVGFSRVARATRSSKNRRSNQMGDETIWVFQKPLEIGFGH